MAAMGAAQAGIEVLDDVGLPVPVTAWSMTSTPAGYRVVLQELHDPWQETWFVIRSDAGDRFNEIEIAVDGPTAGSPLLVRIEGARSIGSIVQTGNAETRIDHVAVHEDLGRVEAQSIGTLVAGRDITGPVIATTAANPMRGVVAVQAGRNITGSVLAEQGRIEFIDAGGRIGDPDDDVVIRARYGVGTIQTEAGAWIDLDLRTDEGTGRLWRLLSPRVAGRCSWTSSSRLRIRRSLSNRNGRTRGGTAHSNGAAWEEPIVRLGDAGLVGRILINTGDVGGVWSSPVHLGEPSQNSFTELHGPAYPAEPAVIGGGSVGVVPFRMHMAACEPVSGSSLPMPPASVLLRWYGPINWPEGPPVHIDRRTPPGEGGWEPAPAGHFLFLPVHGDPTALSVEGPRPNSASPRDGNTGFGPRPRWSRICPMRPTWRWMMCGPSWSTGRSPVPETSMATGPSRYPICWCCSHAGARSTARWPGPAIWTRTGRLECSTFWC